MVGRLLSSLETYRPFTEGEAWGLYRIIALSEAFGWTLLLTALAVQRTHLPAHQYAVQIAGQIHGVIFLVYFVVSIVLYGSLAWGRLKMLAALLAGVPPYGTLVFELYAAHRRTAGFRKIHRLNVARLLLGDAVS